jgi:hypothetical protein
MVRKTPKQMKREDLEYEQRLQDEPSQQGVTPQDALADINANGPGINSVNPDDDTFLSDYVTSKSSSTADKARLSQVLTEIGGTSDIEATDQTSATTVPGLRKLQGQADRAQVATDRQRAIQEKADFLAREKLRKSQATATQKALDLVNDKVATPVVSVGQNAVNKIASLPTLGSIGLLLTFLLLLLFIVVNVDGKGTTRIKQIWYMLNGRASLIGRVLVGKGSSAPGSSTSTNNGATVQGNNGLGNNGSSTGQGNGALQGFPNNGILPGNLVQYDIASAKLASDLAIGNFNGDFLGQVQAFGSNAQLTADINTKQPYSKIQQDSVTLAAQLNKLNDPLYNNDYGIVYRDLGF